MTSGLRLLDELLLKQWIDSDYTTADFVAEYDQLVQRLWQALEDWGWSFETLVEVLTDHQEDVYRQIGWTLDINCPELV